MYSSGLRGPLTELSIQAAAQHGPRRKTALKPRWLPPGAVLPMLGATLLAVTIAATPTDVEAQATPPRGAATNPADIGNAPTPTTTVSPLTVTAPARESPKLPEKVSKFVESHGVPGRINQLSRWGTPLCPKTEGLSDPFNRFVSVRILQVAAFVKAPVEKHPNRNFACKTNVLVVFTTKPQELMEDVRKHHPNMLGFHYAAQTKRLARFTRPMQAWYITGTASTDGRVQMDTEFGGLPGGDTRSRLTAHLRNEMIGTLVVIDANQILGRQIGGLADNVAMLVLSHTGQADHCSELPTILDFMVEACHAKSDVEELTDYDVSYLKALYAINPEDFLHFQQGAIFTRMIKEIGSLPEQLDPDPAPDAKSPGEQPPPVTNPPAAPR